MPPPPSATDPALYHQVVDLAASINGLVVLSSAILAIIQYVDRENLRLFDEARERIKTIDLPPVEGMVAGIPRNTCKELRKAKDVILAEEPLSPRRLIFFLLCLIPCFALMHAGVQICPVWDNWLSYVLKLVSGMIFFAALFMLSLVYRINKSQKTSLQRSEDFIKQSSMFMAGCKNTTSSSQPPPPANANNQPAKSKAKDKK